MKHRLCDLQESSGVERRKVPESVVEVVGLAVDSVVDIVGVTSPGAVCIAD